jgi:hypothetical protein
MRGIFESTGGWSGRLRERFAANLG